MVQSLIKPESKVGRRPHKFQEGLGTEFHAHPSRAHGPQRPVDL